MKQEYYFLYLLPTDWHPLAASRPSPWRGTNTVSFG